MCGVQVNGSFQTVLDGWVICFFNKLHLLYRALETGPANQLSPVLDSG